MLASALILLLTYNLAALSPRHALAAAVLFSMVLAFFVRSCVEMGMLPPMSELLANYFSISSGGGSSRDREKAKKPRPRPSHFFGFVDHTLFRVSAWALSTISTVAPRLPNLLAHPLHWPCLVVVLMIAYSLTLVAGCYGELGGPLGAGRTLTVNPWEMLPVYWTRGGWMCMVVSAAVGPGLLQGDGGVVV